MATPPDFSPGQVLTAAHMDAVGLWLVKSQTIGSGVSSVTVTDAFSAEYDNYRVIISGYTSPANASLMLQLNNSTGSTYQISGVFLTFGTTTVFGYGPAAAVRWTDIAPAGTTSGFASLDIFSPFLASPTRGHTVGNNQNGMYNFGLADSASVSNTGFILSHSSGSTLTGGTITVYGYRKG